MLFKPVAGRLLPIGGMAVNDFGSIVSVDKCSVKRAWYFLGTWSPYPELTGCRQIGRREFYIRGGSDNPRLRKFSTSAGWHIYLQLVGNTEKVAPWLINRRE